MYSLNAEYPDPQSVAPDASVWYADLHAMVLANGNGTHLLTVIEPPQSWTDPAPSLTPYFFSPELLYWFSAKSEWRIPELAACRRLVRIPPILHSIHLFVHQAAGQPYYYIGKGQLTGSGPQPTGSLLLLYHIEPRLPREAWLRFGGYDGWLVRIGRNEHIVPSHIDGIRLVANQWGRISAEIQVTRYDGDLLQAVINDADQAVVSYLKDSVCPEKFSGTFDPGAEVLSLRRENGDTWDVPVTTVVTRHEALKIIESYMATGCPIGVGDGRR
jgi:hypothetical protein